MAREGRPVAATREVSTPAAWIIDGNYNETLPLRLERADTVVFLDTPWWLCASRAFLRGIRKPGGEMPEGCEDSRRRRLRDEWGGVGRIWRYRRSEPESARSDLVRHGSHAMVHVLRSRREAREFLHAVVSLRRAYVAAQLSAIRAAAPDGLAREITETTKAMAALEADRNDLAQGAGRY